MARRSRRGCACFGCCVLLLVVLPTAVLLTRQRDSTLPILSLPLMLQSNPGSSPGANTSDPFASLQGPLPLTTTVPLSLDNDEERPPDGHDDHAVAHKDHMNDKNSNNQHNNKHSNVVGDGDSAGAALEQQAFALEPALPASVDCDRLTPTRCAPYVVVLGAPKCGTNALLRYLSRYPGVRYLDPAARARMLQQKGWAGEINWPWRERPLTTAAEREAYAAYFPRTDWATTFAVDKSTGYLTSESAAAHMPHAMPRTHVLAVLCDPTRRVWSDLNQWYFKIARDREAGLGRYANFYDCRLMSPSLAGEALKQMERLRATGKPLEELCPREQNFRTCSLCAFLRGSHYLPHLASWHAAYGDHLHVVDADRLRHRPRETVMDLLEKLGLETAQYPPWRHLGLINSHRQKDVYEARFPPRLRRLLNGLFMPMMPDLRTLTGESFAAWQISSPDPTNVL